MFECKRNATVGRPSVCPSVIRRSCTKQLNEVSRNANRSGTVVYNARDRQMQVQLVIISFSTDRKVSVLDRSATLQQCHV